ncbi:Arc family DNA-binding protein [Devosia enhydra]|uniref:Arc family DNA-binding protein n=1 Tax=Devosia enhydra TaxID=665118 RepID=UPI0009315A4E|nr:Arc family DNA-binding protein [Devosia enhydra]
MRQQLDKIMLRLPDGMRDRIRNKAAANRRSMNAEIVHYLDRALVAEEASGALGAATPARRDHPHPVQGNEHERDLV